MGPAAILISAAVASHTSGSGTLLIKNLSRKYSPILGQSGYNLSVAKQALAYLLLSLFPLFASHFTFPVFPVYQIPDLPAEFSIFTL